MPPPGPAQPPLLPDTLGHHEALQAKGAITLRADSEGEGGTPT